MNARFVLLWTDVVIFLLAAALVGYAWHARRQPNLRATWHKVFADAASLCSAIVLGVFLVVTLLDSVHYRPALPPTPCSRR